ncbi:MAG: glucuronate isomerase, partial [Lysinibacillus sp.]|nr:glucuronate isomerase [Lysinibacillus sp.]
MKPFLDDHFLLQSNAAASLYNNAAKYAPIFDFHCHLDPQAIWENKPFSNITELWLGGDHYKWRAMRLHGISEHYITGDASDWEKFEAWAKTVPFCIGNPLYHWTHMELNNVFGINKLLSPETAKEIYDECNEKLKQSDFTPRALIQKSNVVFIGTTDDPLSNLQYHQYIRDDETFETVVAPTFRPDGALFIERPTFNEWVQQLQTVSNIDINCSETFLAALQQRIDYFHQHGCCPSDHDLPSLVYVALTAKEFDVIFQKRRRGEELTKDEVNGWKSYLLTELGKMYSGKQWVMQLHMGAMRNNNTKMMNKIGPDTGFDSIGEANFAEGVSRFLDALDQQNALPRTILYNLNQKDNQVLA